MFLLIPPSVAGKNLVYPITKQEMNVHKQTTGEVGDRKRFATTEEQNVVVAFICTGCILVASSQDILFYVKI